MLKLAEPEDHDRITELLYDFYSAAPFKNRPFSVEKVSNIVDECIHAPRYDKVIICLQKERVEGVLLGAAVDSVFSDDRTAFELAWWIDPAHRSLGAAKEMLSAYEYWAEHIAKATAIQVSCLVDGTEKLLTRLYTGRGYKEAERAFIATKE